MPLPDAPALTRALQHAGVLHGARVTGTAVEASWTTVLSCITRLRLNYDQPAPAAPATLIHKSGHPDRMDRGWNAARHETAFYHQARQVTPEGHVPRCFDAQCDEAAGTWHLLLEDLGPTHAAPTAWPLPPGLADCRRIVRAHARHQAAYWDPSTLAPLMAGWNWRDAAAGAAFQERLAARVAAFIEAAGDLLTPARQAFYAAFIAALPRLGARYAARANLTLVHGDAHAWNCLLPRDGGEDVRLFDWDSWRIDIGASDLAYMMAVHWFPDRRRHMEGPLLDAYHAELLAHGVTGYDRGMLAEDYRLATLWQLATPAWQQGYGIPPVIWWNNMERILLAAEDLGCRDLV